MSRDDLHFRLRIPPDLKNQVQKAAEMNRRSMTAEIIARLESTFVNYRIGETQLTAEEEAFIASVIEAMRSKR